MITFLLSYFVVVWLVYTSCLIQVHVRILFTGTGLGPSSCL